VTLIESSDFFVEEESPTGRSRSVAVDADDAEYDQSSHAGDLGVSDDRQKLTISVPFSVCPGSGSELVDVCPSGGLGSQ
jgi:hypothetical protein